MERYNNNGEFEKLLRDNANQYRMYPSDKVWTNINSALHSRRKWYGITAAIMFLVTSSVVSIIIYNDSSTGKKVLQQEAIAKVQSESGNKIDQQKYTPALSKEPIKANRTKNVEDLIRVNDAYHFPNESNPENALIINNNTLNEIIDPESLRVIVPLTNSFTVNDPVFSNAGLEKFNDKINTQIAQEVLFIPENLIGTQNSFNEQTEESISQKLSALASQNVSLTKKKKPSTITAQFYFTPTVSYRKLSENKKVFNRNGMFVPVIDVNSMVKHKPAMGLEFGIEGRYHINDRLSAKTGLQFNINRYDIRAYSHTTEIATVALNNGNGLDSRATTTNFRNNFGGTDANWLENFYFQAAAPIGVEYVLSNNKNVQWGISGTIQPTYVIGDRAYLISSDYKNYARFPDLMRRWNISSGFETFVSYSTGKLKWQVGPHVRFQHLSSFVSALTVKEKLFAAGMKIGVTINK